MEDKAQLQAELQQIEKWEKGQKDLWIWEKIGRLPFLLLDKVTPKFIQEKVGQIVDEMVSYVESGGKYLVKEEQVAELFEKRLTEEERNGPDIAVTDLPLSMMDAVADELTKSRAKFAKWQGATTGFGGVFTLALDIPMLFGQMLKIVQELAMTYGYDPNEKVERVFVIKCVQFTSCDFVGKQSIIEELTTFDEPDRQRSMIQQLEGWREVVLMQAENFGWKKLFQMIPIAGVLFGAYMNKKTIEDIAEVAKMLYRKRRIVDRLQQLETPVV